MKLHHAVGIDLGTTNTVAASLDDAGHTAIVRDREGNLLIPSVVLFDDDRTIVGEEARLRGRGRPERLAACAKRELGRRFYSQPIDNVRIPPEVIQACILSKLRNEVTARSGPEFGVVVAVPAYFTEVQRRLTAEAATMAGLQLLDIINEPTAAMLALGEHTPLLTGPSAAARGLRVLVYNLGGYSFEATLLEAQPDRFTTLATDFDLQLGGHDWDLRLVDYLAEQFIRQHQVDPRDNPHSLDQLLTTAIRAKHALGVRHQTAVTLHYGELTCEVRLTRTLLADLTRDLLERTAQTSEAVLAAAGLGWSDVSQVLLVGGATRMPAVQQLIEQRTGRAPDQTINPSEAIARGAAIYAQQIMHTGAATDERRRFQIQNVTTHSLGIESNDPKTGKRINKVLIRRGTALPAKVTKDFALKASKQKSITIRVLEGDSADPEKCVTLGHASLHDLPDDLSEEWPVEITYSYNASGLLEIDARLRYTDRAVHLEVTRTGALSHLHLQRWKSAVQAGGSFRVYREIALVERREQIAPAQRSAQIASAVVALPSEAAESASGLVSFLKRYMPFAFGRGKVEEPAVAASPSNLI